jgi:hypothetical protein
MTPSRRRWWIALAIAIALASSPHAPMRAAADRMPGLPRLMFWAWERPEDLRGLAPERAGVAFLAATYRLSGTHIEPALRHQPLRVDPATPLMAVVRIETDARRRPTLDTDRAHQLAEQIASLRSRPGVRALQIDFDATLSERPFYRELLSDTRAAIGTFPLSITALASWCMDDDWLEGLPIDEAVPMLFRLGPVNAEYVTAGADDRLRARACAGAVGISTDEPTPALRGDRRTYVFHPKSWTRDAITRATTEATRWR